MYCVERRWALDRQMDGEYLMPLKLPSASSINNHGSKKGRSTFLKRLFLVFAAVLTLLALLYVPVYHSAQGPLQGLGEIPILSPAGGSQSVTSVAQLSGWADNTTRDVRIYVQPESNTTIISPVGICVTPPILIIVVCSSVSNQKARDAIRDTWANKTILENYNATVEVAFLVGESSNDTLNENIENESLQYKDIIQEKFQDSYNNLTIKSIMMLKWVTLNCGQAKYLMKTDDDMFVNVPVLIRLLQARPKANGALMGSLICRAKPITDSKNKWFMPKYMYAEKMYPNYLSGTGYVMSLDVASKLYATALDTQLIYLEDVYLTGICARRAKLRPTNHPGFSFVSRKLDPCVFRNVITAHRVSASNLYAMWKRVNNSTLKCVAPSASVKKQPSLSRKGRNTRYYPDRGRSVAKCV
ncbi:beta-1,3-galactosyltransferase 1 isoform X1 [Neodiprion pinetum]|uniref:Hexosyltransferase n=1 Tax=Neodiprion lecontei TaxID=441921 RepID=A0A6J0C033_NEOLC|nr:beta-1,3-galactosyltransferase 1 isoform X1 [Neodiprion lecontei]XP_046465379.1 beta-1,3-galactosyltransferase 1-like isoform X1 [Neodiprion pinetum]XP_046603310.1 beta-1,3-galactosyltransferase 1-like isoform X1 [Neodiprion virginianus]